MAGDGSGRSFEYTPTWIVAVVCFVIVFISFSVERALHHLGKLFKRKNQETLFEGLQKLKEELMLLGFISLLLTVFQRPISSICIPQRLYEFMLPCKIKLKVDAIHGRRLLAEEAASDKCSKGYIPFLSLEALHQLHIFIFILAVVHAIFCASTMILGGFKIREWKRWELSIRREPAIHLRSRAHIQEFIGRSGNYWRRFCVEHCPSNPNFDFHKYMLRTLEQDFKKIIGISWYLWLFVVMFLLVDIAGWNAYFWLSFLPLFLLLIVGAKLEHIITQLAREAAEKDEDTEGSRIRPSDELFWFSRPIIVLYAIHFILFQNSFEIAFFCWIWSTYGFGSCIMEGLGLVIPRLVVGVIVQVLCSYSTLPLYALVTQMGSMFKQTVFDEFTHGLILGWAKDRKSGLCAAQSHTSMNRLCTEPGYNPICIAQQPLVDVRTTPATASVVQNSNQDRSEIHTSAVFDS